MAPQELRFHYHCQKCGYRCDGKGIKRKSAICPVCSGAVDKTGREGKPLKTVLMERV